MEKTCEDSTEAQEWGAETDSHDSVIELLSNWEELLGTGGSAGRQSQQPLPRHQPMGVISHLLQNQHPGAPPENEELLESDQSEDEGDSKEITFDYDSDGCPKNYPALYEVEREDPTPPPPTRGPGSTKQVAKKSTGGKASRPRPPTQPTDSVEPAPLQDRSSSESSARGQAGRPHLTPPWARQGATSRGTARGGRARKETEPAGPGPMPRSRRCRSLCSTIAAEGPASWRPPLPASQRATGRRPPSRAPRPQTARRNPPTTGTGPARNPH